MDKGTIREFGNEVSRCGRGGMRLRHLKEVNPRTPNITVPLSASQQVLDRDGPVDLGSFRIHVVLNTIQSLVAGTAD